MLYFAEAVGVGNIKIGFTDGESADDRIATLQTGSPVPLRLLKTVPGTQEDEKNLHRRFAAHRVTGEWFKPVPELLALIGQDTPLECDGKTITERSVAIRILAVGRKQFSKALLVQLPTAPLIDWHCAWLAFCKATSETFDLRPYARGEAWGWVAADPLDVDQYATCETRWLVFARDGRLFKYRELYGLSAFLVLELGYATRGEALRELSPAANPAGRREAQLAETIYHARASFPGWRDEDQLFFGV